MQQVIGIKFCIKYNNIRHVNVIFATKVSILLPLLSLGSIILLAYTSPISPISRSEISLSYHSLIHVPYSKSYYILRRKERLYLKVFHQKTVR